MGGFALPERIVIGYCMEGSRRRRIQSGLVAVIALSGSSSIGVIGHWEYAIASTAGYDGSALSWRMVDFQPLSVEATPRK